MIKTFLDAGVLITAHRGEPPLREAALSLLAFDIRLFVASVFLELELLPKPIFHRRDAETWFLREYFKKFAHEFPPDLADLVELARTEAEKSGLAALDALHLAAAHILEVDEFVTTERSDKPIHRTALVRVVSLELFQRP